MKDSFKTRATLKVGNESYEIFSLKKLDERKTGKLPYTIKIFLENLLRNEDGATVKKEDVHAVADWSAKAPVEKEIAFMPARVLLQDFTGVPAVVDLAAMRDAVVQMGGEPKKINPLQPVELVIDHSVQVDAFGTAQAFKINADFEFERNKERYALLRWGQKALDSFRVVPPDTGIVHQVNLEYLARVVMSDDKKFAYPDTLVGTDSHTTMINGLGVLGWGVGGIEAEAVMLGQPLSMLIPEVVGFRLSGKLPAGATATDLVLTITQMLRKKGVVGKFVEFYGPGIASLTVADRATISNMCPEYGATAATFPLDAEVLTYLRLTGREEKQIALIEAYAKEQGLFHTPESPAAEYSDSLELDLSTVEPCLAGPKRPQDRVPLKQSKSVFLKSLEEYRSGSPAKSDGEKGAATAVMVKDKVQDGSVVIAAITSCTNTSNPSVMIGAGLLAKKAVERGLKTRPWVKTSLAPGSQVVMAYLEKAGLIPYLEKLGFHLVGFGCTTCIGNSGPLPEAIQEEINRAGLMAVSVLSGNRNFEGRINPLVRANYLASPPLVVAYALAGRMDVDLYEEPIGNDEKGNPVFLKEIWPSQEEIAKTVDASLNREMYRSKYADVFKGDARWRGLPVPDANADRFAWDRDSLYIKSPPFFENLPRQPEPVNDIAGARVLALLGDSVTTDHISPAGSILPDSPAGKYLIDHGVQRKDFNSYGARRGNHEVMIRGTFANNRLKNQLVPGVEGGWTVHLPDGERLSIYDAAVKYESENVPLVVLAGKEYGSGSSRDWAAKGTRLLGVRAVIAESFERIHRSNLIGMGVLPLEFLSGQNAASLGLTGWETYEIAGIQAFVLEKMFGSNVQLNVKAKDESGNVREFKARGRIDTPQELEYYRHGGILQYVLRQLLK